LTIPGVIESLLVCEPLKVTQMRKQSMNTMKSLSHTVWDCKYHIVWIPKYRKKRLYGELRRHIGQVFRELASQRECTIEEGHLMSDHVHILISIPPKYAVSQVVGFIKGKSAIAIARTYMGKKRNFTGQHFWARGYHVSTVGRDEQVIREYIQCQEEEDRRIDQLDFD
jgi:putative transposase